MTTVRDVPSVMLVITKGETGGAQTHVLTLCEALAGRARLQVAIGGADAASSPLAQALVRIGVPVHAVPGLRNSLSPLTVAAAARELARLVRREHPDLLHAHSAVAGVVTRVAGRLARTPVMYTVHGFGFKPEAPPLQRRMAFAAEWALARLTRHMVCVSHHEQALARRLPIGPDRTSVIPNGVPDVPYRASPAGEPMRIVMVARLAAPKRPDLLLRAAALLRDRGGDESPLTLVGDGADMDSCQDIARELGLRGVRFTGNVTDVPQRLAQHEVFVLASDHEGLPISVLEAMRAGLAIVASDLPGIRELVRPDQEALLVPNDAQAFAAALERLRVSPPLREQFGRAARQRYDSLFRPDRMADAVHRLYGQICAHEPQHPRPQ